MTQTYRTNDSARWGTGQGFNLSPAQVDINFWDLIQRMIAQEARPDPSAGISYFSISGTMMYVHMTDGTTLGPYELPVATFTDRGGWTPSTPYLKMDTFNINGGLYVVVLDHTSGLTFDPGANDGAGHDYYQLMIQTPGSSLPVGGAVGQLLKKTTTTNYAVGWGYTDASVVSYTPSTASGLTATNVKDALDGIGSSGGGGSSPSSTAPGMDGTAAAGTSALYSRGDHIHPTDVSRAPLASPTFTGVPAAPTPTTGTNTTQIATTAFVAASISGSGTFIDAPSDGSSYGRLNLGWTKVARLASAALTGTPTAPTVVANDNSNKLATTSYVDTGLALKASLASPAFTGTPGAPTATAGTNTTQLATTAYVTAAVAASAATGIPQNSQSAAYTTVLTDAGKAIYHPAADTTARTFTIDSNANVAFPLGTVITFVNEHGAGVLTIAITSDVMRLAGAGTTGNRTLAADGVATAFKMTATSWLISGTGLT